jgi:putative heme iron utilization protein
MIQLSSKDIVVKTNANFTTEKVADETSRILKDATALQGYKSDPIGSLAALGIEIKGGNLDILSSSEIRDQLLQASDKDQLIAGGQQVADVHMVIVAIIAISY